MVLSKELQSIKKMLIECEENEKNSTGVFSIIRNSQDLTKEISELTSFLDFCYPNISIGQRVYHLKSGNEEIPKCPICDSPNIFHRLKTGYFKTCGDKDCKRESKSQNAKKTFSEKYSEGFFSKGSDAREKYKKTMLQKYGVDHNFKDPNSRDLSKSKMLETYGTAHALQNKELVEKRKKTCIEKYGTLNFIQSDKAKETNFEKYGAKNPMTNKEISLKVSVSSSKTKRFFLSEKLKVFNISILSYSSVKCVLFCDNCKNSFDNHPVTINAKLRIEVNPCTVCNPGISNRSKKEDDLLSFIRSIYTGNIEPNYKKLFSGSKTFSEVDLFLPEISVAFEFNGIFWHSEFYKSPTYHQEKTRFLLEKGIRLFHIWEDDWNYKRPIVESMIRSVLGATENKIHARKCEIRQVNFKDYKNFCESNHLKGFSPASLMVGLYFQDTLVSVMSFLKTRKLISSKNSEYNLELIRSCSLLNSTVVGGMSRIMKWVSENNNSSIITYCDMSFSPDPHKTGYNSSGFSFLGTTQPGFYWVVDKKRSNRLNWTKSKLVKLGFNPEKTADGIMADLGYYKIWDCGNYKFIWPPQKSPSQSG